LRAVAILESGMAMIKQGKRELSGEEEAKGWAGARSTIKFINDQFNLALFAHHLTLLGGSD
jgi:hypothetical protein